MSTRISVIGAGSWGTALARMLAYKHTHVNLWVRKPQSAGKIRTQRQNEDYLPGIRLPENISVTSDLHQAAAADVLVLVVPSHAMRAIAQELSGLITQDVILLSCAKGFENQTNLRMSEVLTSVFPTNPIAALSGPNHAEEVAKDFPTATVIASRRDDTARQLQEAFATQFFRPYTNHDITGVELAGALKNIIALGAGIVDGLGYGDNTTAALMTRGLAEIARLGMALGAESQTFAGLAGVGDLIATCTSQHSRNRRAGQALAQGKTRVQIEQETNMVVEGFRATRAAWQLAQKEHVSMPITEQLYSVLFEDYSPRQAAIDLMMRENTSEREEALFDKANWMQKKRL